MTPSVVARKSHENFPQYDNGDVVIMLGEGKTFQLHAEVLKRNSSLFRAELTKNNSATLSKKAKHEGITVRWWFQLVESGVSSEGPYLKRIELDSHGRPFAGTKFQVNTTGFPSSMACEYFIMCFRAFYSKGFDLVNGDGEKGLLSEVNKLASIAGYLGCLQEIECYVDVALMSEGQILWRIVSGEPLEWAKAGLGLKSHTLVKEAAIHLIGKWNTFTEVEKAELLPDLRNFIDEKFDELQNTKKRIECDILKFYPIHMMRNPKAENTRAYASSTYANDIYDWMALCLFRYFFAANVCNDQHRIAYDGGFALYQKLWLGGKNYLGKQDLSGFHRFFPFSQRGKPAMEDHLGVIKRQMKTVIHPLMVNATHLDVEKYPVPWLTCATVSRKDVGRLWAEPRAILDLDNSGEEDDDGDGGVDNSGNLCADKPELMTLGPSRTNEMATPVSASVDHPTPLSKKRKRVS